MYILKTEIISFPLTLEFSPFSLKPIWHIFTEKRKDTQSGIMIFQMVYDRYYVETLFYLKLLLKED